MLNQINVHTQQKTTCHDIFHISRSRIHQRTISLRFLGIILRVPGLEVSLYNVYCTLQTDFKQVFLKGRGGGGGGSEQKGAKLLRLLSQLRPRIRPQQFDGTIKCTDFPVTGSKQC
jgi:hypothetical protein